jgi:hypothetical protein
VRGSHVSPVPDLAVTARRAVNPGCGGFGPSIADQPSTTSCSLGVTGRCRGLWLFALHLDGARALAMSVVEGILDGSCQFGAVKAAEFAEADRREVD